MFRNEKNKKSFANNEKKKLNNIFEYINNEENEENDEEINNKIVTVEKKKSNNLFEYTYDEENEEINEHVVEKKTNIVIEKQVVDNDKIVTVKKNIIIEKRIDNENIVEKKNIIIEKWQVLKKKNKNILIEETETETETENDKKLLVEKNENKYLIEQDINTLVYINEYNFKNKWNVLIHYNFDKNWKLESYLFLMNIINNQNFWEFFNNFENLNYIDNQFFVMKDKCSPMWEDLPNGANIVMSIKTLKVSSVIDIWINICAKFFTNYIDTDKLYVKGIVFNMKYDLINIKIIVDNPGTEDNISNTALFVKEFLENEYKGNRYSIVFNKRDTPFRSTYNPRYNYTKTNDYNKTKYKK